MSSNFCLAVVLMLSQLTLSWWPYLLWYPRIFSINAPVQNFSAYYCFTSSCLFLVGACVISQSKSQNHLALYHFVSFFADVRPPASTLSLMNLSSLLYCYYKSFIKLMQKAKRGFEHLWNFMTALIATFFFFCCCSQRPWKLSTYMRPKCLFVSTDKPKACASTKPSINAGENVKTIEWTSRW